MQQSSLGFMVDPLRALLEKWDGCMTALRTSEGKQVVGAVCGFLPMEVLAAAGTIPVRIPARILAGAHAVSSACGTEGGAACVAPGCCDAMVVSASCCRCARNSPQDARVIVFESPSGYGEAAAVKLHESLRDCLQRLGCPDAAALDPDALAAAVEERNAVRRLVRGICAERRDRPAALSQEDLLAIMEYAACFPPAHAIERLSPIRDALNDFPAGNDGAAALPALVHGGFFFDWCVLDEIEEAGCRVDEDDLCNGRRQFDISYNAESPHLYAEILDAFSYRPLCPSIRPLGERVDLLYRLLRTHGIETVVFVGSGCCVARDRERTGMSRTLMRLGIDPVAAGGEDPAAAASYHVKRMCDLPVIECGEAATGGGEPTTV